MKITATVANSFKYHSVKVQTNNNIKAIEIPPKETGNGSSVNGGELLFLAIATCYCNDLYREAAKMNITIENVEVEVSGNFGAEGEPGYDISYNVKIKSNAPEKLLQELIKHTDSVAEIHNTIRKGSSVTLYESAIDKTS